MNDHDNELDSSPVEVYSDIPPTIPAVNIDEAGLQSIEIQEAADDFNVSAAQEGTRAKIALNFTYFFLFLVASSIIIPFLLYGLAPDKFSQPIENAKELVTILASILAGPFGFIVGFYFKQNND